MKKEKSNKPATERGLSLWFYMMYSSRWQMHYCYILLHAKRKKKEKKRIFIQARCVFQRFSFKFDAAISSILKLSITLFKASGYLSKAFLSVL